MDLPERFKPGDRVRIDQAYWSAELAGRTGTVAAYPEGVLPLEGCCWVELDVAEWKAGVVDGAAVDEVSLRPL